ncbi:MAG: peptidylprolyl isomerase [Candidatus Aegiribacteria sp.]|nr:peptidylprolyl isomerase [Candidatus Aegiribacteria sp.]
MKAENVLLRISTLRVNYSDQVLIEEYVTVLTDRLKSVEKSEEEQELETVEWTQYELPFDPDSISLPDTVVIKTDVGDFTVLLWGETAPITCSSFWNLAEMGFYDGVYFHRVIPGFVAQAGCPEGVGTGSPGYVLPNERSLRHFGRGVLGMADAGLNTGGSQFFIMLDDHGRLDGRYTAFGMVLNQTELDRITVGTRIRDVVCLVN